MFSGLRSRWTIDFRCTAASVEAICRAICTASFTAEPGAERALLPETGVALPQGLPLQVLHHDEDSAARQSVEIEDVHQPRVPHHADGTGLIQQAAAEIRLAAELRGQHLHRRALTDRLVYRLVDHAHPAATDLSNDAVGTDGLPDLHLVGVGRHLFAQSHDVITFARSLFDRADEGDQVIDLRRAEVAGGAVRVEGPELLVTELGHQAL